MKGVFDLFACLQVRVLWWVVKGFFYALGSKIALCSHQSKNIAGKEINIRVEKEAISVTWASAKFSLLCSEFSHESLQSPRGGNAHYKAS